MPASHSAIVKNFTRATTGTAVGIGAEHTPRLAALVESSVETAQGNLLAAWDIFTGTLIASGDGHLIPGTAGHDFRKARGEVRPRRTAAQKVRDDLHAEGAASMFAATGTYPQGWDVKVVRTAKVAEYAPKWEDVVTLAAAHGVPAYYGRTEVTRRLRAAGVDLSTPETVAAAIATRADVAPVKGKRTAK